MYTSMLFGIKVTTSTTLVRRRKRSSVSVMRGIVSASVPCEAPTLTTPSTLVRHQRRSIVSVAPSPASVPHSRHDHPRHDDNNAQHRHRIPPDIYCSGILHSCRGGRGKPPRVWRRRSIPRLPPRRLATAGTLVPPPLHIQQIHLLRFTQAKQLRIDAFLQTIAATQSKGVRAASQERVGRVEVTRLASCKVLRHRGV